MIVCQEGRADYVKHFINKGDVDLNQPPETMPDDTSYVKTSFLLAAVASGSTESVLNLIKSGKVSLETKGFICISPVQKNLVYSNVVGCAAWYGKSEMLN
jgi:hypothetical protein